MKLSVLFFAWLIFGSLIASLAVDQLAISTGNAAYGRLNFDINGNRADIDIDTHQTMSEPQLIYNAGSLTKFLFAKIIVYILILLAIGIGAYRYDKDSR